MNHKPVPKPGDSFYDVFESDLQLPLPEPKLRIQKVVESCSNGYHEIVADDHIGYDCYWSVKLSAWVYSLE